MKVTDYYEVRGQGKPIVFIHGSFASTSAWRGMVDKLADKYQCILIKLPGHCGVPDPVDFAKPSMSLELSVVQQVVQHVTDQPIHLVGHSYGGVVALAQALEHNLAVRRLTLFEPVATWILELVGDEELLSKVNQFLAAFRQRVAQQVPYAGGDIIDFWCDSSEFEHLPIHVKDKLMLLTANNIRHWDLCTQITHSLAQLQHMRVPTSLVVGSRSAAVAHGVVRHLHRILPHSQKQIIGGANHFLVTSHVDACLAAM